MVWIRAKVYCWEMTKHRGSIEELCRKEIMTCEAVTHVDRETTVVHCAGEVIGRT